MSLRPSDSPSHLPTVLSSLIALDDSLGDIQPHPSDGRSYGAFELSLILAVLGLGLCVSLTYIAMRRLLTVYDPDPNPEDGHSELTDAEDITDAPEVLTAV